MILVAPDGRLSPLLQDWIEGRVRQILITITKGDLVDNIETKGISQFIEAWLSGVVRGTDIIDGSFLHQFHIMQNRSLINHFHRLGICAMTCHTAQFDRLTIEFKDVSIDSQFTKAKLMFKGLKCFAFLGQCRT